MNNEFPPLTIAFLWNVHFGFISSLIGIYFYNLSGNDYFLTGFLLGIPYLLILLPNVIFGKIADFKGEKPVLVVAFLVIIISDVFYLMIFNSFHFLVAYLIFNLFLAAYGPAIYRLSSRSHPDQDIFGKLFAAANGGYLC